MFAGMVEVRYFVVTRSAPIQRFLGTILGKKYILQTIMLVSRAGDALPNSRALTKLQSIFLIVVIVVATVSGVATYFLLSGEGQSSETIKIGILDDLDSINGHKIWLGAQLAAEEINSQGGILGRKLGVVGEDTDFDTEYDAAKISSALTRLLTYHKVDYVLGGASEQMGLMVQDVISQHRKIFIATWGSTDNLTQRVAEDYDKYKYFFRVFQMNDTSIGKGMTDSILLSREITGFNKIGYLAEDSIWNKGVRDALDYLLPEVYGFDLVYRGTFPPYDTLDFSSYFAAAETAGVEILVPLIAFDGGIPFVKEYYDRQSPMVVYGGALMSASLPESWGWTEGKCEHMTVFAMPVIAGYPLTSKTLVAREAFINRWGESPNPAAAATYDVIRFILPDALERAGTTDTDEVIKALEKTSIETSMARNFLFTSSHDVMYGEGTNDPDDDNMIATLFQWQNGELVPIYPKKIMEEAGATFTYPPWPGPWD